MYTIIASAQNENTWPITQPAMQAFLWGFIDFKVLESAKIGKTAKKSLSSQYPRVQKAKTAQTPNGNAC